MNLVAGLRPPFEGYVFSFHGCSEGRPIAPPTQPPSTSMQIYDYQFTVYIFIGSAQTGLTEEAFKALKMLRQ